MFSTAGGFNSQVQHQALSVEGSPSGRQTQSAFAVDLNVRCVGGHPSPYPEADQVVFEKIQKSYLTSCYSKNR